MSDVQAPQQPTPIDVLVDRLAQRIGQLTAENEWLRVQLELASKQNPQTDGAEVEQASGNGVHNGIHSTPDPYRAAADRVTP